MRAPLLLLALALAGCAELANLRENDLIREATTSAPQQTVERISDVTFEPLTPGRPLLQEIRRDTPAFSFSEGRSYFKAYSLPTPSEASLIRLKTFIVGALHMPTAFVFYPHFTFFDAEHRIVSRVDPKLVYENNFWNSERSGWIAEVMVPPMAKFVAVHTPERKFQTRLYYKEGMTQAAGSVAPAGKMMLYMPANWWDAYLPASGAGRFEIDLRGGR
jgi:maltose operon periplasmic protein